MQAIGVQLLAGCGVIATNHPQPSTTLTLSAAASLQTLLQTLHPLFQTQFPHLKLSFNFGSSGALQRQIEQGAQVDLFLSAASSHMDALERQNLIAVGTRRSLFQNRIVLVTAQHIDGVKSFQDLLGDRIETVAIGHPNSVPVGTYAQETLESLNLYQALKPKLIYGKDARQVLTYVTTGNVDAALVYGSDVMQSHAVKKIAVAQESWHSPIVYPGGAIANSPNLNAAITFLDFLQSKPAQQQIAAQGFQTLETLEQRSQTSSQPIKPTKAD